MDDRLTIPTELVERLIADQFPHFAPLTVRPLVPGGWNNRSFRLGPGMVVRLPSAERYEAQVAKEQRFLKILAPHLPLPIPQPVAMGRPDNGYPFCWGIYRWISGETALSAEITDRPRFAADLGAFLKVLHGLDGADGPPAGPHNFYRGGPLATYDQESRSAIDQLGDDIDAERALSLWEQALASQWQKRPVWLHGDVAPGNLLVDNGRLSAVIDFGGCGIGDPACDLAIAWTFMDTATAATFRATLDHDEETWVRARGWALWKTLITLRKQVETDAPEAAESLAVLERILAQDQSSNI